MSLDGGSGWSQQHSDIVQRNEESEGVSCVGVGKNTQLMEQQLSGCSAGHVPGVCEWEGQWGGHWNWRRAGVGKEGNEVRGRVQAGWAHAGPSGLGTLDSTLSEMRAITGV